MFNLISELNIHTSHELMTNIFQLNNGLTKWLEINLKLHIYKKKYGLCCSCSINANSD